MKGAPLEPAEIRGVQKARGAAGEVKLWYSVCLRRPSTHLIGFHARPQSHRLCLLGFLRLGCLLFQAEAGSHQEHRSPNSVTHLPAW